MDDRDEWLGLISRKDAWKRMGGIGRSTALRNEATDPTWPQPILLSARRVAYRAEDVKRWIDSRPLARPDRTDPVGPAVATIAHQRNAAERKAQAQQALPAGEAAAIPVP